MLTAVRRLQAGLHPATDHLPSSLCRASILLLEGRHSFGIEGQRVIVDAIAELARGLGETLTDPDADWTSRRLARPRPAEPALPEPVSPEPALPKRSPKAGSALSLAFDGIQDEEAGELMIRMGILTQEQVDCVLSMQSLVRPPRPFGEIAIELGYTSAAEVDSARRMKARAEGQEPSPVRDDPWGPNPI